MLLFQRGTLLGEQGIEIQTVGRLISNPHARAELPTWLETWLHELPAAFTYCRSERGGGDRRALTTM